MTSGFNILKEQASQNRSWLEGADIDGRHLREVFDHFTDVFYVTNSVGEIVFISKAAYDHLGYKPEEMIGQPISSFYVDASTRDEVVGLLVANPGEVVNVESQMRCKDGSAVWASTDARLILGDDGKPESIEGVARNITEIKEAARILEANQVELARARDQAIKMEEAARKANEAKTRFLTNVSHEMRTPLTGILGALDLIDDPNLSDRSDVLIETARSSGKALLDLINELLDVARLESGEVVIQASEFPLGELLLELGASFRVLAAQKGLAFLLEVADDFPASIVADRRRIVQVLNNFLGNAIKFTQAGQVNLRASMRDIGGGQAHVRIEVEDTGVGIAPHQIEKIFERFERVEEDKTRQIGAGLGLAISREYIELMGGSVDVSSEHGRGSVFSLEFTAPSVAPAEGSCEDQNGAQHTLSPDLKILVADDKATNRMLVGFMLERFGIKGDFVESGEEVLERLEKAECDYDVILMDIQMTGINGIEATRQIRDLGGRHKNVPILAFTADIFPEQMLAYWEVGMNGYIAKPIELDRLVKEINSVLRSRSPLTVDRKASA